MTLTVPSLCLESFSQALPVAASCSLPCTCSASTSLHQLITRSLPPLVTFLHSHLLPADTTRDMHLLRESRPATTARGPHMAHRQVSVNKVLLEHSRPCSFPRAAQLTAAEVAAGTHKSICSLAPYALGDSALDRKLGSAALVVRHCLPSTYHSAWHSQALHKQWLSSQGNKLMKES